MAAHRYWRIYTGFTSGTYVSFAEIELHDVIGGADLTGSGTASASVATGGAASNAVDNNTATFWSTYNSTVPNWWAYDFGISYDIVEVVITPRTGFYPESPQYFLVEYSDDGITWVATAYVIYKWTSASPHTFNLSDYSVGSVPHDFTSNNSHSPYVISASSSTGAGAPYKALARADLYGWLSSAEPSWWKIDLGSSAIFGSYALLSGTSGDGIWLASKLPKDWTMEGSNDDSNWTLIDTVVGETGWGEGERRTFAIDSPSSYRYYRISITANNGYVGGTGKDYISELFFFPSPDPVIGDSLANWADSVLVNYFRDIRVSDSLANWLDSVSVNLGIGAARTVSVSDSFTAWKDGILVYRAPDRLDIRIDDLGAYLTDSVIIGFIVYFNNNPIIIGDNLNNWLDSISQLAILPGIIGDTLNLSDSLGMFSEGFIGLEDEISWRDRVFIQFPTLPIGADDLNYWNDSISMGEFGNEEITVGDDLNNWADGTNEYRATAFSSYIRRYLNDVIN